MLTYRSLYGSTAEYLSEFLMLIGLQLHVSDFSLLDNYAGHLHQLCYRRRYVILCCRDLSLEQLARSDPFVNIFVAVQEVAVNMKLFTRSFIGKLSNYM